MISGGVGITPTLAMAEAALADDKREVKFLHYARNSDVHCFGAAINDWVDAHPQFSAFVAYEQGAKVADEWPSALGRPTLAHFADCLPQDLECDAYALGPKPFMAFLRKSLIQLGLAEHRIRHEFFGPAEALD